jgi:5-methylcytosine-specific restriction endonuclease McrA
MNPLYSLVAQRAGHRCEYCRAPEAVFNFPFEVEHIAPTSQQGSDDESNLALACRSCNLRKADHRDGEDAATRTLVPLFNPRQHRWEDHFRAEPETGVIQGLTPTGRATVARLQMNSPAQLAARRQWMRLGLFP